jgi:hypothetical protein
MGRSTLQRRGAMQRGRLRFFAAVVLVLISAGTIATPADIPEVPAEIPTPRVTFIFAGVIYNNPPAWTCRSPMVNACLICTNTSGDVSPVQVMSLVMSGYEWLNFTIPIGGEVRSCGNIIHLPVFPN